MLVECKQCGAPLDVGANASLVRCSYCGGHNRVRSMRTIAEHAPVGWAPPPTWTPPSARAPLPYLAPPKQTSAQMLALIIIVLVVVTTMCPLVFLPLVFLR